MSARRGQVPGLSITYWALWHEQTLEKISVHLGYAQKLWWNPPAKHCKPFDTSTLWSSCSKWGTCPWTPLRTPNRLPGRTVGLHRNRISCSPHRQLLRTWINNELFFLLVYGYDQKTFLFFASDWFHLYVKTFVLSASLAFPKIWRLHVFREAHKRNFELVEQNFFSFKVIWTFLGLVHCFAVLQ